CERRSTSLRATPTRSASPRRCCLHLAARCAAS
ncbi:MAG: hypothetical protein AVDCRST_MAG26-2223, partial [uncultured Chloroflexia bacterium]